MLQVILLSKDLIQNSCVKSDIHLDSLKTSLYRGTDLSLKVYLRYCSGIVYSLKVYLRYCRGIVYSLMELEAERFLTVDSKWY